MSRIKVSKPFKSVNLWMVGVMLLIGLANILWAERLTFNGGLGWDGKIYGGWVKDFYGSIFVHGVSPYYAQRILPSAIVHYAMRLFSVPLENDKIIQGFEIYNLILLLIATFVWGRIADKLTIENRGKWFGFFFLFLNYAILKNNFYHSVLTDTSAFTLGILLFYFFLVDSKIGIIAVMVAGAFTWPTVAPMAALLFVLPYRPDEKPPRSELETPPFKLNIILAALVSAGVLAILLFLTMSRLPERIAYFPQILRIDMSLLWLSIAGVVVYLFFSLKTLLADPLLFVPRYFLKSVNWQRTAVVAVAFILIKLLQHRISSGQDTGWGSLKAFVLYNFLVSLTEPLIFLVAHVIYYGPAIILLVFFWKPFCRSLSEYGLGMKALVILNLLLSTNPQSRYQINVAPVFIILLVKLLDRSVLKEQSLIFWLLLYLFYSKVWYVFNTAPQVDDGTMAILLRFPLQHYFMSSGPWMSHEMYLVQGSVVLLTGIFLYFVQKHFRSRIQARA